MCSCVASVFHNLHPLRTHVNLNHPRESFWESHLWGGEASDHNESPNSKSSSSITNRPLQGQELITSFLIMYHF